MPDGGARHPLTVWERDLPWIDPHIAAQAFADVGTVALLDGTNAAPDADGRYAFLCADPFQVVSASAQASADPLGMLAEAMRAWGEATESRGLGQDPMPFRGGAVGLVGYEVGAALAGIAHQGAASGDPPDLCVGLYDLVIGFDRLTRTCRVHATGLPAPVGSARRRRAAERLDWAERRLAGIARRAEVEQTVLPALEWRSEWDRPGYVARARQVLEYIAAGDIYQANLTVRHLAARPSGLDGWAVQAKLRATNPAPFAAWLRGGGFELCCSSPERFVRIATGGQMQTEPIKGTIARDGDRRADQAAAAALSASAKDRAENTMIVDVLRHDLGRVAVLGSVAVPSIYALKSFATVHHLVSTVTARLRPELGPVDLLRAALPGGSITGAPKVRAMQIIAQIEQARRGPYCGCVVALGWDGTMDSNIVIRSVVLTRDRVIAQSGGAIVADSDPDAEYDEMLLKFAPMRDVFGACG